MFSELIKDLHKCIIFALKNRKYLLLCLFK